MRCVEDVEVGGGCTCISREQFGRELLTFTSMSCSATEVVTKSCGLALLCMGLRDLPKDSKVPDPNASTWKVQSPLKDQGFRRMADSSSAEGQAKPRGVCIG